MSLLVISNKALRKLGVGELRSLDQPGKAAERCRAAVVPVVKEVTVEHNWGHATEWGKFNLLADAPPFGYQFAYQEPAHALSTFDIRESEDLRSPRIHFEPVRGKKIYTDAAACYARFLVYYEADLGRALPCFIEACAFKLAAEIAAPLAKVAMSAPMLQAYVAALDWAMLVDSRGSFERPQDVNQTHSLLSVREYPASASNYQSGDVY